MKKSGISLRRCEIVSNLFDKEGNQLFDLENMKQQLSERNCIKDYCYIIHDKDVYTEKEEEQNPDHVAGELKAPHIHLLLRFEKNQPQKSHCIADWFKITENFVSKVHGKWENAVLYQVHANAPKKYQYDIEEVTSNFDIEKLVTAFEYRKSIDAILLDIVDGKIPEYEKNVIPPLIQIQHAREIREAFKCRTEYLQTTVKHRKMECVYLTGASQSGKTTFAKKIAETRDLPYYISSSGNDPLGEYAMEPCIILDDIRPSVFALSELLKLLDNNTVTSVKSRYKNKCLANCKLLIITTVLDIETFYSNVFSEEQESSIQFKRRCNTHIRMDKDRIYISKWDAKLRRYSTEVEYINNIVTSYLPKVEKTKTDVKAYVKEIFPFLEEAKETEQLHGFKPLAPSEKLPWEE